MTDFQLIVTAGDVAITAVILAISFSIWTGVLALIIFRRPVRK